MRWPLLALFVAGCATNSWARIQEEFPEVQANCGLQGVDLLRDATDQWLLHLVFRHRNNMEFQARQDGRLACAEHWARERGYRVTTSPQNVVDG